MTPTQDVAIVSLGCARNEVDSEELAGRLLAGGLRIVAEPSQASAVIVNTCGFIDAAKQESIAALLDLVQDDGSRPVIAVGCMAQRYGHELAAELPEVAAVLGFDEYADMAAHVRTVIAGGRPASHAPEDRRQLLPISPRSRGTAHIAVPGHGTDTAASPLLRTPIRHRLNRSPVAPLKIASGCDRRCAFCAIPAFRGAFVSRPPADIVAEARRLADDGVREIVLVSENSTSYGKDLGHAEPLVALLESLAGVAGIERIRLSYLQPAELRPAVIAAMVSLEPVADYFDLSFQHASPTLLRRMRRFGGAAEFLDLIARIRALAPDAGIRSNVIVGFPGEGEGDLETLHDFLGEARLDAVGVFGYSDEEGTEAASLDGGIDGDTIAARVAHTLELAESLMSQRAAERIGSIGRILVEGRDEDGWWGRTAWQGDADGLTRLAGTAPTAVGEIIEVRIVDSSGPDLRAHRVAESEAAHG